jgi:hypothetical protein
MNSARVRAWRLVRTTWCPVAYGLKIGVPASTRVKRRSTRSRRARTGATSFAPRATRIGKVRKAFWLDPRLLDEARASLGASTEREAVEMALDLVGFRRDLARGARALRRLTLSRID